MRIVLVDDNEMDMFINVKLLESGSFAKTISTFLDPEEAISHIGLGGSDAVIVDNQMPIMSGYDLLSTVIKTVPTAPAMVVLTATVTEDLTNKYKELHNGIHLLEKPLDVVALRSILL